MAIVLRPNLAPPSSMSLGKPNFVTYKTVQRIEEKVPSYCQFCQTEGIYFLMSSGTVTKSLIDGRRASDSCNIRFRCRNPLFGTAQTHWSSVGWDLSLSQLWVAADYSDSVPDSSNFMKNHGYHPLEELKAYERRRYTMLTSTEMARTTVEANNKAILVFPGMVHNEPHGHSSWAEFQYVIDDCGACLYWDGYPNACE